MRNCIEKVIKNNPELMEEFSINSLEEFTKTLGDRYDCETRNALMRKLTKEEQLWVKDYYLRNCNAGKDRFPACIKVKMNWAQGIFRPAQDDYIAWVHAEFNRIKSTADFKCESLKGESFTLHSSLTMEFEDDFFSCAEAAQWEDTLKEMGSYVLDAGEVSIQCKFANGRTYRLNGNFPGYYPYDKLDQMAHDLYQKVIRSLTDAL